MNINKSQLIQKVVAWDLYTRLFHWLLVFLVISAWFTAEFGDMEMTWHKRNGYAIFILLVFRLLWGIVGSSTARFRGFIYSPAKAISYFKTLRKTSSDKYLGHNPLGSWMVWLLLFNLVLQIGTGLFASDELFANGPLSDYINEALARKFTLVHELNFFALVVLIILHISAVIMYLLFRKENLIRPMVSGKKPVKDYKDSNEANIAPLWLALICITIAVFVVALVITGFNLSALKTFI